MSTSAATTLTERSLRMPTMPVRTPALSAVRTRRTERDPVAWGVMVTDVLGDEIDCLWD